MSNYWRGQNSSTNLTSASVWQQGLLQQIAAAQNPPPKPRRTTPPAKKPTNVDWLRGRINEITAHAFSEIAA